VEADGEEEDKCCYYDESADYTDVDGGGYIVDSGDSHCYVFLACQLGFEN
jgi:hypothetical protein